MLDEEVGDLLGRRVVGGVEALLAEERVLAHEVGWVVLEPLQEREQRSTVERLLQVAHLLDLDACPRGGVEGVARGGAAGVVQDGDVGHEVRVATPADG